MSTLNITIRQARWGVIIALILVTMAVITSSGLAQEGTPKPITPHEDFNLIGNSPQAVLPDPIGSGVLHVNGMAFKPDVYNTPYEYTGVALSNPSGSPVDYHAAITLPHGAEIKKVIFVYYDLDWSNDITMHLSFQPFDYLGYGYMATATSNGGYNTIGYVEVTNISPSVIDSETMTYLLNATIPGGGNVYLVSARIEYSFNNFAPLIGR